MNESSNREEAIFDAASQLPPEKRADYLREACSGDEQLRKRVEELLQAHEQAGGFMEEPAAPAGRPTIVLEIPLTEKPGDKIGRYKLLQQIGEGGCGVVYMAEQEEPVRRRVALKVIKLGMDTKSVIARFEAERQALAMMDHPNIAKVLDAGATENGRPYFVMELVRGIKITDYCDQNKLSTDERLGLFMQVCNAIQHAHQKGIIHRDIKPSNILVTLHDGVPVPKVIDFGIAKATQGRLTDQTLFTAFEQFIGTPAYMSPEQAEMSGLDVDTRSDIYALGVLLYELLTGRTPFDPKELLQAGLDELRRTIREKEPARPSTRLSTMLDADLTAVALRRQLEAPKLIHMLSGDLDWIVMKSLEKDRTRRYETANGLAMDIQRYLTSEPVVARPPSTVYKLQKLVRRNKAIFAAVGTGVAALVLGLVLSLYLFVQERSARQRAVAAEKELARLLQEAQLHAQWAEKLSRAGVLLTQDRIDKIDEAERIIHDIPPHATMLPFYNAFGLLHARRGQWPIAISNLDFVIEFAPTDHLGYHLVAPLLAYTGDTQGYRHRCEQMLDHFGETTDPEIAERITKDCCILPPPAADLEKLNRLADTALAAGTNHPSWGFFAFAKGLVEYRQGHYAAAAEWSQAVVPLPDYDRRVQAYMVLAMAQFQLKQTNESQATLAKGVDLANRKLAEISSEWNDWIIARLLIREATVMLGEPKPAEAPGDPPWLTALEKSGFHVVNELQDDGTWLVEIDNQPFTDAGMLRGAPLSQLSLMQTAVTDLGPLRGMPLKRLRLGGTKVADLSPLQGMSLEVLQISGTPVSDLTPLRGMPLRDLRMTGCTNLTDLEPLAGSTTLQNVILPPNAKHFEFLRDMTNLARVSFKFDPATKGPAQSAADFWAEYDKNQTGKTNTP